jgi:hypothetical protein
MRFAQVTFPCMTEPALENKPVAKRLSNQIYFRKTSGLLKHKEKPPRSELPTDFIALSRANRILRLMALN